jgi:hypothetical protein
LKRSGSPSLAQMPFDIVGEHGKQNVCADPFFKEVENGPNFQIDAFEGVKCTFDA